MILAGRRINDGMAAWVAQDVIKAMLKRKQRIDTARVLVMGFTFKENCPDTRNTKVADLVAELGDFVAQVEIFDPLADRDEARRHYGVEIAAEPPAGPFDAIVLAVRHRTFVEAGRSELTARLAPGGLIYDLKGVLAPGESDAGL
jgi:UDP-N-acetyl-D-galactosamine dehydrogenase